MNQYRKKILIFGATGMLGNAVLRYLSGAGHDVVGTARSDEAVKYLPASLWSKIHLNVNIESFDGLVELLHNVRPSIVINCIGLVKQLAAADDPLLTIPINSLFPHRLANLSRLINARFIHISTDCVFSGAKGNYGEGDNADAMDLYGRSKLLGEVDYGNSITLRTSIIGHELYGNRSLVDWFLSQNGSINGYTKAFFSGMPTIELARVINQFVIPNSQLTGLYHVSVDQISKFDLLSIIAKEYKKEILIIPDESVKINRSLNSSKFRVATGFTTKPWPQLVADMHEFG